MKKTARYYRTKKGKESYKKKKAYDKVYHSSPERRKYRSALVKERRKRGIYGKGGSDVSHKKDGTTTLEDPSTNRARNRGKK